jgi:hypothetical protein
MKYDPAKPLGHAISNIKYQLGKYYIRMGLIINEWPLMST